MTFSFASFNPLLSLLCARCPQSLWLDFLGSFMGSMSVALRLPMLMNTKTISLTFLIHSFSVSSINREVLLIFMYLLMYVLPNISCTSHLIQTLTEFWSPNGLKCPQIQTTIFICTSHISFQSSTNHLMYSCQHIMMNSVGATWDERTKDYLQLN